MSANFNKKILICGAGVSGLSLAYWLKQYGFSPTLIERSDSLRVGGYKVDIRGAALEVIKQMGIYSEVFNVKTDIKGATVVDKDGNKITEMRGDTFNLRMREDLEIMRGDLCQILIERVKDIEIFFGESVMKLTQQSDGVRVEFLKNKSRIFDLVVGADGLHSNIRRLIFGEESQFIHDLNMYIAIFSIPNYLSLDQWEFECTGDKKLINVYSLSKNIRAKAAFLFYNKNRGVESQHESQQKNLINQVYSEMRWEIPNILKLMDEVPDFYFDSITQIMMNHWHLNRIVLVGDAAYCASPVSGQGTSLALVGSYVLAGELSKAFGEYKIAFRQYEKELRSYVKKNQKFGQIFARNLTGENKNKIAIFLHEQLMSIFPSKLTDYITKQFLEKVNKAANAVKLKKYT